MCPAHVMSQRHCRATSSQHMAKGDVLQGRASLIPRTDGCVGEIPRSWGRTAESEAGCAAAEGSVQPAAIIGHAGSTHTLNAERSWELVQNQKHIAPYHLRARYCCFLTLEHHSRPSFQMYLIAAQEWDCRLKPQTTTCTWELQCAEWVTSEPNLKRSCHFVTREEDLVVPDRHPSVQG